MTFTATTYESSVTWNNGVLTGDADLIRLIQDILSRPTPSAVFNYWGERDASLSDEFTAYLTIGDILLTQTGDVHFDHIPDNPDGYQEEGVWDDGLIAAAWDVEEFFNKNHDKDGKFSTGSGGDLPKGNTETWANKKAHALGLEGGLDDLPPEVRGDVQETARRFRAGIGEEPEVRIRVPFSVIEKVAAEGMKSQHETTNSQGAFNPELREAVESRMFSAKGTRPIYGYVPTGPEHAESMISHYGQLALVLTAEAQARTTVTRGDSLVVSSTRSGISPSADERLRNIQMENVPAPIKLNEARSASDERLYMASPEDNSPRRSDGIVNYFETQTHGGVRPSDIAKIIMPYDVNALPGQTASKWQGFTVERMQKLFPNAIIEVAQPYTRY